MDDNFKEKLLDVLTKIQKSLENIEQSSDKQSQHEVIKDAVVHALTGKNPSSTTI